MGMIGKDSSGFGFDFDFDFDFDVKSGESKGMLLKPVLLHLLELDISVNYHTLLHREYGVCIPKICRCTLCLHESSWLGEILNLC